MNMTTEENIEITFEDIKKYLDESYELIYIDYNSSLDGNENVMQKSIQIQEWYPLDEELDEWLMESSDYGMDYAIDELKKELYSNFEFEDDELDELIKNFRDEIEDEIHNRDNSTPIHDLSRNTSDLVMFYDTGLYLNESLDYSEVKQSLRDIKKLLKIKVKDYDKTLEMMISQASYGGRLVVYFRNDFESMMKLGEYNTITFKNPMLAIIDTYNGSGDHTDLENFEFSLPLDTENIFLDKTIKYNYTYEVCGMYESWCDCTVLSFSKTNKKAKSKKSSIHAEMDVEEMYNKAYKNGGCTFGDMDLNRHRNTFYLNDFPCGTHCPKCGTFWID